MQISPNFLLFRQFFVYLIVKISLDKRNKL